MNANDREVRAMVPESAVYEEEGKVLVELLLPGVRKEDLSVTVDQGRLVVEGKRKDYAEGGVALVRERRPGLFRKTFTVDERVDAERSKASFDKGVLTLEFEVKESAKPRKIQIA